jgi:hypothetical protein
MSGHTPGPWSIFDHHDATRINVRGPNEEFVADCADGFYSDETDDWVMADESLPNARLIAAAPNLLAALEVLLAEAHPRAGRVTEGQRLACAAIAKARGEQA